MIFKSKRDVFVGCVIWIAVAFLFGCGVEVVMRGGVEQWFVLIIAMVICLLLWMWFATYYQID
jgi:hypothetical protein